MVEGLCGALLQSVSLIVLDQISAKDFGNYEEEFPEKPVGQLSVGRLSADRLQAGYLQATDS